MKLQTGAIILAVSAVLAASMAGCSSNPTTPSPSANTSSVSQSDFDKAMSTPTTLTLWSWVPNLDKEVALFETKYPQIKVDWVNPGSGSTLYTKLTAALQAKAGIPDVTQMEYQYLPTYLLGGNLLDIKPYVGSMAGLYPDWVLSQVSLNGGVYAIPMDTGPMGMLYRQDLLQQDNIPVPTTWDQFATAATAFHQAHPDKWLTEIPANEFAVWLGFFWQAGAKPFTYDGKQTVGINLTSDQVKKVIDYWQPLIASGAIDTSPDWTDQWYAALNDGTYAALLSASWAPAFLVSAAPDTVGNWRVSPLPQWDASKQTSANWGGSTLAVTTASQNPIAAAELARFIDQDPACANIQVTDQSLFPSLNSMLSDDSWANQKPAFYGGQAVNQEFAQISQTVNTDWQWPPFLDEVSSTFTDTLAKATTDKGDLWAAVQAWQAALVKYAQDQGFTVVNS